MGCGALSVVPPPPPPPRTRTSGRHLYCIVPIALCLGQVCEGANTMDIGRTILQNFFPRRRLDAGTYGTMGVGASPLLSCLCCPC